MTDTLTVVERLLECMDAAEQQAAWHLVRGDSGAWIHTSRFAAKQAALLWGDMPFDRERLHEHADHDPAACWILRLACREYGVETT